MRIVTLNVRNPSFDDGPNAWPHRREAFFETLRRLDPDVLCMQEVTDRLITEVFREKITDGSYGYPREDEAEATEYCTVMLRPGVDCLEWDTEWLGDTPKVSGSIAPGARCPRVMTWVEFENWVVINTHLDHVGKEARTRGMAQVIARADALGKPCLIAGDLNAPPEEPALTLAQAAGFVDLAEGTGPTFHGFGQGPLSRIDYILARGPWRCERAWVEPGAYSDHWAVAADLELG